MRRQIFLATVFYLILNTGYAEPDEKIIGKDIKIVKMSQSLKKRWRACQIKFIKMIQYPRQN